MRRADVNTALAVAPLVVRSHALLHEAAQRAPVFDLSWMSVVGRRTTVMIDGKKERARYARHAKATSRTDRRLNNLPAGRARPKTN